MVTIRVDDLVPMSLHQHLYEMIFFLLATIALNVAVNSADLTHVSIQANISCKNIKIKYEI